MSTAAPSRGKLTAMTDQHSSPGSARGLADRPQDPDPACDVAHGAAPLPVVTRTLVAVFESPVAGFLVEPDAERAHRAHAGITVTSSLDGYLDHTTDVVVTDHHRPELGPVLRDALAGRARWVGIMGNPRHPAPHIPALAALGVTAADIGRVHRPIGLNIGSHTPAEIALATLAGLIADRNGRPGGFGF
jgi:xanthine dehydrogenase accessory factor